MQREFKYLSEDILKSRYPSGEPRPHSLLLAAQRMLDSDINTIGLVTLEALLAKHHKMLLDYCAPTYKPCSDPQYKSGELFAKATTEYITLSRKLSEDFSNYQDELFDLRDDIEMYLTERCGG